MGAPFGTSARPVPTPKPEKPSGPLPGRLQEHGWDRQCYRRATLCGVETISHREMRNRSGTYLRRVEAGESFLVSNNGTVVAILGPPDAMSGIDVARGRGQSRPAMATAGRFSAIRRTKSALRSAQIIADTRGRW